MLITDTLAHTCRGQRKRKLVLKFVFVRKNLIYKLLNECIRSVLPVIYCQWTPFIKKNFFKKINFVIMLVWIKCFNFNKKVPGLFLLNLCSSRAMAFIVSFFSFQKVDGYGDSSRQGRYAVEISQCTISDGISKVATNMFHSVVP